MKGYLGRRGQRYGDPNPEKGVERGGEGRRKVQDKADGNPEKGVESYLPDEVLRSHPVSQNPEKGVERDIAYLQYLSTW